MRNIEQEVVNRYQRNIEYIRNKDSALAQRIEALSMMIELGEYKERYELEYIAQDDSFDLYDSVNQSYVYNKEASVFDKEAVKNTNFDKQNSFDLFQDGFYNISTKLEVNDDMLKDDQFMIAVSNDISEYTKVFNISTKDMAKEFKTIDRFVFVGTILGTHIEKIANKLKSQVYFICEANLEVFRLSLFVCSYYKMGTSSNLLFSIMDDELEFIKKFQSFLDSTPLSQFMLKYYSSNYNIQNYFERILKATSLKTPFNFTYNRFLEYMLLPSLRNMKTYPSFHTNYLYDELSEKEVLYLVPGPSLGKNIEWIKKNYKNYFVVTIGAAISKLINEEIYPNLIISVDSAETVLDHFPLEIKEKIKGIPLLTSQMTNDAVFKRARKEDVFLFETMTTLKSSSKLIDGSSVGEVALNLILTMGAKNIYMLGTDLALDQDTGSSHIESYKYGNSFNIEESLYQDNSFMHKEGFNFQNTVVKAKGNFRDVVLSTTVFNKSIVAYNNLIRKELLRNPNIKIHNLSDGAYIEGTIPTKVSNLSVEKKLEVFNIKKFLIENSSVRFCENDFETIKNSKKYIEELEEKIRAFEKIETKSYKLFLSQREDILRYILINSKPYSKLNLRNILDNYILITEPYIAYNLNDKKQLNETSLIKDIKKIWVKQMLIICDEFKLIIDEFLNE